MTDDEMIETHIAPIARRLNAIVHILRTSKPEDAIRECLCTLVEDNHEAFQALLDAYAVADTTDNKDSVRAP